MILKSDIQRVLQEYFGTMTDARTINLAADEIVDLEVEWEQLDVPIEELGFTKAVNCPDICFLAEQVYKGETIRLFRKRKEKVANVA